MLSQRTLVSITTTTTPSLSSSQHRSSPPALTCIRAPKRLSFIATAALKIPYRSSSGALRIERVKSDSDSAFDERTIKAETDSESIEEEEEEPDEEKEQVGRVRVPRQKYISVSKTELLDAIVSHLMTGSTPDQVAQFRRLSSCLDSIFHAEHKEILEEMRNDYFQTCSMWNKETSNEKSDRADRNDTGESKSDVERVNGIEREEPKKEETELERQLAFAYDLDFKNLFASQSKKVKRLSGRESRRALATRFQRSFMQLLCNAKFEELSTKDLTLASSLNSDYLLTLPIYVDWKKASAAKAIIFRRGYAAERQRGRLIVPKLDHLQSRLLQKIFFTISKPLGKVGARVVEAFKNASKKQEIQDWIKNIKPWLKELSLVQQPYSINGQSSDNFLEADELSDCELPIWLAAQRAVSRYEGLLSINGPRYRLLKKFLTWAGLVPPTQETQYEFHSDSNASEPYARPIFLSRISLSDIWRPASRKSCGNDLWKQFKTSVSILLSKSVLQEPAFQELILLYSEEIDESDNKVELPPLQLKVYERIPIPDLSVIFPHKKLSFRIIDSVRLDIATILGLLAYTINHKFEDILSSPSAVVLDVIGISALIIFLSRVALGYKQTWDRYQLLVNKTLYEKTLASGFGSVYFLLDASEQQQYKEAILAYAILLNDKQGQVICHQSVQERCERFMFSVLKEKVEMPVDKAISTLSRLGLVMETTIGGETKMHVVPCLEAHESLRSRWNSLLV